MSIKVAKFEITNCIVLSPQRQVGGSQVALVVKNPPVNAEETRDMGSKVPRKIPWRRAWQPTPVFLPGESHGQRSLVGYSPLGHKESDMNEVT